MEQDCDALVKTSPYLDWFKISILDSGRVWNLEFFMHMYGIDPIWPRFDEYIVLADIR